eukprot:gene902-397_t
MVGGLPEALWDGLPYFIMQPRAHPQATMPPRSKIDKEKQMVEVAGCTQADVCTCRRRRQAPEDPARNAKKFLNKADYNLEAAIALFFDVCVPVPVAMPYACVSHHAPRAVTCAGARCLPVPVVVLVGARMVLRGLRTRRPTAKAMAPDSAHFILPPRSRGMALAPTSPSPFHPAKCPFPSGSAAPHSPVASGNTGSKSNKEVEGMYDKCVPRHTAHSSRRSVCRSASYMRGYGPPPLYAACESRVRRLQRPLPRPAVLLAPPNQARCDTKKHAPANPPTPTRRSQKLRRPPLPAGAHPPRWVRKAGLLADGIAEGSGADGDSAAWLTFSGLEALAKELAPPSLTTTCHTHQKTELAKHPNSAWIYALAWRCWVASGSPADLSGDKAKKQFPLLTISRDGWVRCLVQNKIKKFDALQKYLQETMEMLRKSKASSTGSDQVACCRGRCWFRP